MRKKCSLLLVVLLLVGMMTMAQAADETVHVTVTIANGTLKLSLYEVAVTDADEDGALTINDALLLAHKEAYAEGTLGYGTAVGDYGLYITKLWGSENGSGFGYYHNNVSAYSLTEEVADGDYVCAFVYTDTEGYSDTYCYFDQTTVDMTTAESKELTLMAAAYDENWNPVTVPVQGAVITIDEEETELVTDENGKVTLSIAAAGEYDISAVKEGTVLVPPVCKVTVSAALSNNGEEDAGNDAGNETGTPETGDNILWFVLSAGLAGIGVVCLRRGNKVTK